MWPVVVTVILGGVVIASCFAGLFSDYRLYEGYQQLSCSGIIGVDDALYGAQSYKGDSYFAGIKTVNTQLQSLIGANMAYIYGNLTDVSSTGNFTSQTLSAMSSALYSISIIPDPTGSNLTLNYNTPIGSSSPNATIPSVFPAILGSQNANSTLVGNAYSGMSQANTNLSTITSTVDSFISSSSAFTASLIQIINQTSDSATSLKSTLITVDDIFSRKDYVFNVTYV